MATITDDNIASVSLKDADRDPDGFAAEARPQLRGLWLRDHRRPRHSRRADPPRRGQGEGLLRAARGGEAQISDPRRRRRARLHAVRDRDRQGRARRTTSRNSGTSAATCRRATASATTCRTISGRRKCRASRTPSSSCSRPSTAPGLKVLKAIARYLEDRRGLFRGRGARRQFGAARAPLSAADRADRRAHPRRRARGHQRDHAAARRRGSGAGAADHATAAGSRSHPSPASW